MDLSEGLWSAMAIIAALLVAIGIFFIAARVFTTVRMRREREIRHEERGSRVIEAHTARNIEDEGRT
jgi:hypothetical protein